MAQALAEKEGEGLAKMMYRKDTGEILGVHIIGLHAADLIHEASNAMSTKQSVQASCLRVRALDCCAVLDEARGAPGCLTMRMIGLLRYSRASCQAFRTKMDVGEECFE